VSNFGEWNESNRGEGELNSRDDLRDALAEFAPELRLLDCGWVLEGNESSDLDLEDSPLSSDLVVDWVAVDASGRMNLLLCLDPESGLGAGEWVDLALEVLHRAQVQQPFILSHLGNSGIRADLVPRLILATDHFADATLRKLSVLGSERMRLIEIHEVRTDSGVSHHLVSRWPEHTEAVTTGPVDFLERLPEALRPTADRILQCLDHVDERVGFGGVGIEYIEWRLRNQTLCALEHRGGVLHASVAGSTIAGLSDEAGAEHFVELVLQRYFGILEDEPDGAGEEEESLVSQGMNVVLSHEELDAFM
jgi:hypothetical protein